MDTFFTFLHFLVMVIVTSVSLDRLKVRTATSTSIHKRTTLNPRRVARKLTAAEKATAKEIRARNREKWDKALEEAQEALHEAALVMQAKVPGHQLDYYLRVITQNVTHSNVKARKTVTEWNAFVAQETFYSGDSFLAAIEREPGTAPIKSSDISKELSAQWQSMSPEDRHEQTQDMVKTLQTARDVKRLGVHNTNLTAFHDARAVVQHIQTEVSVIPPVLDPSDACSDCESQSSHRP
jgi:proline dehydrogenase